MFVSVQTVNNMAHNTNIALIIRCHLLRLKSGDILFKMKESQIENQILQRLNLERDGYFWKNHSTGIYDPKKNAFRLSSNLFFVRGVSDILGVYQGKFVAIEVKTPDKYRYMLKHWERLKIGQITNKDQRRLASQINFIETIRERGGIAGVACDMKTAMEILKNS